MPAALGGLVRAVFALALGGRRSAISISVSVSGHPASGWGVTKRHLSLGGKTVHKTLNGASLTPGKKYALKGKVTFASGGSHQTLKAAVKLKACPLP
jgi:hypothetical protein